MVNNYSSLLFELSSTDRLDILFLLEKNPLKLSHISKKLDFTVQETSRNVTRLVDARLVDKDVDGAFHVTSYGNEVLNLISGFKFLFDNRDYFMEHSAIGLPALFRGSLSSLKDCRQVNDVMMSFRNVEKMIETAEEFVWILTDQVLASTIPYLLKAIGRSVEFRLLMPMNYVPSGDVRGLVNNPVFEKASRNGSLANRFLENVDLFLCLSEKEVGALAFPRLDGKFDYVGFAGRKDSQIEWSTKLYLYYWSRAKCQIPDQLAECEK